MRYFPPNSLTALVPQDILGGRQIQALLV